VSTPITFSGFNNIDFNVVLQGLMQQASQPLNVLQSRQKALETQVTRFDALTSRISARRFGFPPEGPVTSCPAL
jgi:flagellar capping protein FliD